MRTFPEQANLKKILLDVGDRVLNDDDNNFIIPDSCLAIIRRNILKNIYKFW